MTQPPLKVSRRWAFGAFILAVGAFVWITFEFRPDGPPWRKSLALKSSRPDGMPRDFDDARYSPSTLVSEEELAGPLRRQGFADGIGVTKGVPVVAVEVPIKVNEEGPN